MSTPLGKASVTGPGRSPEAPIVAPRAVAEIAGLGVLDQHVDQRVPADLVRHREGRGLVAARRLSMSAAAIERGSRRASLEMVARSTLKPRAIVLWLSP